MLQEKSGDAYSSGAFALFSQLVQQFVRHFHFLEAFTNRPLSPLEAFANRPLSLFGSFCK